MKMLRVARPVVGEEKVKAVREVILSGRYVTRYLGRFGERSPG